MYGIVLLSKDGYYLGPNGELPERPMWDKDFLLAMCKNKRFVCSENTRKDLPKSLLRVEGFTGFINLGISTFENNGMTVLFIVRSKEKLEGGKKFRTPKGMSKLTKQGQLEIYVRD